MFGFILIVDFTKSTEVAILHVWSIVAPMAETKQVKSFGELACKFFGLIKQLRAHRLC